MADESTPIGRHAVLVPAPVAETDSNDTSSSETTAVDDKATAAPHVSQDVTEDGNAVTRGDEHAARSVVGDGLAESNNHGESSQAQSAEEHRDDDAESYVGMVDAGSGMEVDSASSHGDTDSTLGSETESSTVSLRESVFKYVEENGRTYHAFKEGKYVLPNDEAEQERLDLQHHLFQLTLNGLYVAPLPSTLHNVLDLATGTGIWAIEFAEIFPEAKVVGTDLSPIQPAYVPPNCSFEISDAEEPWLFHQQFDYIHGRALLSCFRDPPHIITESFAALRPGGVLELQDPQMPIRCIDRSMDGRPLAEWSTEVCRAAEVLERPLTNSQHYGRWMRAAGFVDVVERHLYWPLNSWPRGRREKLIGMWAQQDLLDGVQGMSMALLTRGLHWSREKVEVLLAGVRDDLRDRSVHSYVDLVIFYGRKPE